MQIPEKLKRTKLWVGILAPVLTTALVILCKKLNVPLTEVEIGSIAAAAIAGAYGYIRSQGRVDVEKERYLIEYMGSETGQRFLRTGEPTVKP